MGESAKAEGRSEGLQLGQAYMVTNFASELNAGGFDELFSKEMARLNKEKIDGPARYRALGFVVCEALASRFTALSAAQANQAHQIQGQLAMMKLKSIQQSGRPNGSTPSKG